jgi:hypothetical protein
MSYRNIEDRKAASKRHYEAHKAEYMERNQRYRLEISDYVKEIKEKSPCADCDKNFPYYVMEFDHLKGKQATISFLSATGRISALKAEIQKCEIVCSNCHRERTHTRLLQQRTRSSAD